LDVCIERAKYAGRCDRQSKDQVTPLSDPKLQQIPQNSSKEHSLFKQPKRSLTKNTSDSDSKNTNLAQNLQIPSRHLYKASVKVSASMSDNSVGNRL